MPAHCSRGKPNRRLTKVCTSRHTTLTKACITVATQHCQHYQYLKSKGRATHFSASQLGGTPEPKTYLDRHFPAPNRWNLFMGLDVHSNLIRLIRDGGKWWWRGGEATYVLPPTRYTVTTRMTLHSGGQLCDENF